MIEEQNEIVTSTLSNFIRSQEICVLRANLSSILGFNIVLQLHLKQEFQGKINIGWIDLTKVNHKEAIIKEFLKEWMPKIGLPSTHSILPGYYLFKNGKLVAYHPGTIEQTKANLQEQGIATIISAFAGIIVGLVAKDASKGMEAFIHGMEAPPSLKVFEFFKKILGATNSSYSQQKQKIVYDDELLNAYRILGVSPDVSDKDLKKAWIKLIVKFHPDKSQTDIEERTRISAEINNAYDLIVKSRCD